MFEHALLDFVRPGVEDYVSAIARLHRNGRRRLQLRPFGALAAQVVRALSARGVAFDELQCEEPQPGVEVPAGVSLAHGDRATDAVVLFTTGSAALSSDLLSFVDQPISVIAPITEQYYANRSVFVATIPKSGTHLLYQLLSEFDIKWAGTFSGELAQQHWYFLSEGHSHAPAEQFFREISVLESGGGHHPLFSSPLLFVYRNPLDIVVSESCYYALRDRTALAHYFGAMSEDERLLRLIEKEPPLGSIRDRVRPYTPWMALGNTIAVSFEELVGPHGSGSSSEQIKTVWSLQLKLHVPGRPVVYAGALFNPDSRTFRAGKINSHVAAFGARHWEAFRRLPQDFMTTLGYDVDDRFTPGYVPRHVDSLRRRPLTLAPLRSTVDDGRSSENEPPADGLLEYRGYYIAQLRRRFWAVPRDRRLVDVWRDESVPHLHHSASLDQLRSILDDDPLNDNDTLRVVISPDVDDVFVSDPPAPELVLEGHCDYNVVFFAGKYFGVPQALGAGDVRFDWVDERDRLLVGDTLEAIKLLINET